MSYKAIVTKIHTAPLEGMDNLVLGEVSGYHVLVSKDVINGQLGVFFEQGGQLSEEFCQQNDLVRRKDAFGNRAGGYFEDNRRVKALRLRGIRSDGFWIELNKFAYTNYNLSKLQEGDQFDELNGHAICNKYETPATKRAAAQKKKAESKYKVFFPKYADTEYLKRAWHDIPSGAKIYISEKLHGTSHRLGHLMLEKQRWPKLHRLFQLLKWPIPMERIWKHVNGTRNVVLLDAAFNDRLSGGFYESEAFRFKATNGIFLHKQEIIFGEIVGYYDSGKPIITSQSTKGLKDKEIFKKLGDTVTYKYGCLDGECDFYVYHMAMVNDDGHILNYTWDQIVGRCKELNLKTVPLLPTQLSELDMPYTLFPYNGNYNDLQSWCQILTEGGNGIVMSSVDPSHLREGVVVRWEHEGRVGWLKEKSWIFLALEGHTKDNPYMVDMEESS